MQKNPELTNELKNARKVLIIRLSSIGDVLQTSVVSHALKKALPHLEISWVVESKSREVIEDNNDLEHVFVWPRREWFNEAKKTGEYFKLIKRNWSFFREIKKERFDVALNIHGLFRADLFSFISGAKYRICLPNPHDRCFSTNISTPDKGFVSRYERYLSVLEHFGIEDAEAVLKMNASVADENFAKDFMDKHNLLAQKFVILNPSATSMDRRWPLEKFAQLGDFLKTEFKMQIVVSGASADKPLAQDIAAQMHAPVVDTTGTMTLKQLGAFIAKAGVFISNDTGPLYIAHAMDTPSVALFGPSDAKHCHLDRPDRIALQAKDNDLNNLTVEDVLKATRTVLAQRT